MKIMSLNLNGYGNDDMKDWEERRRVIAHAIDDAGADLVALQAVAQDSKVAEGKDQASQLAAVLGGPWKALYQPACQPNGHSYGSAFLTRLPLKDVRSLVLDPVPLSKDPFNRMILWTKLTAEGRSWTVCNAHLSSHEAQRQANVKQLAKTMQVWGPALVVGDFNAAPNKPCLTNFRNAGWHDVWSMIRPSDDGKTWSTDQPQLRVDYAFANDCAVPLAEEIRRTGGTGQSKLSQHYALLVDVR